MNHLTEEQLVLYYYREAGGVEDAAAHLEGCAACRDSYEQLSQLLNHIDGGQIPERGPEYGSVVWQRLAPVLPERPEGRRWFDGWFDFGSGRLPATAAAMACLLVAAFLVGRWSPRPGATPMTAAAAGEIRERILVVAVGDHLDRSQRVLAELVNAGDAATTDIADQRDGAADLLQSNRLFRQTAQREGDAGVAVVLDDLERVLVEIAHSPSDIPAAQLDDLRRRIEAQGILFKVRVVGSKLRSREISGKTEERL